MANTIQLHRRRHLPTQVPHRPLRHRPRHRNQHHLPLARPNSRPRRVHAPTLLLRRLRRPRRRPAHPLLPPKPRHQHRLLLRRVDPLQGPQRRPLPPPAQLRSPQRHPHRLRPQDRRSPLQDRDPPLQNPRGNHAHPQLGRHLRLARRGLQSLQQQRHRPRRLAAQPGRLYPAVL